MIKRPKDINNIINKLTDAGFDVYCAGQCITAGEIGEDPQDWDLYTDCPQDKLREMFPEGEKIGSRTTRLDYTTFVKSTDVNVADRFEGVIADVVTLKGSMEDQLKIYDFTCEAIAQHPYKEAIDPYGGIADIRKKIVRAAGDIDAVFKKSPIKIFRALRYVGLYGFDLTKDLSERIAANAGELKKADREEILFEFSTIINGNHAGKFLKMLKGLGLIPAIIGEGNQSSGRREQSDYDILSENIDKIKHIPLRRMALFYICFDKHYAKAVTHLPHEELDMEYLLDVKKYLPKMYFSANDVALKKFIYKCGTWDKYNFMDKLAKAQIIVYDYHNQRAVGRDAVLKQILLERQPIFVSDLRIDADDIIEAGITDDPERAEELLHMLPDVVHENPANNDREKLLKFAKKFHKSKFRATFREVKWLR